VASVIRNSDGDLGGGRKGIPNRGKENAEGARGRPRVKMGKRSVDLFITDQRVQP